MSRLKEVYLPKSLMVGDVAFSEMWLVAECSDWFTDQGFDDPMIMIGMRDDEWAHLIELPEELAVEFTLRWL